MRKLYKEDKGMLIVEASLVFPVMFFVLIFLMYMGNLYFQKARVDNAVSYYAIEAARQCVDPWMVTIEQTGSVPKSNDDIKPYRAFDDMSDVKEDIAKKIKANIKGSGLFTGMDAKNFTIVESKYTNYVIYGTYELEATYKIKFPIKFIGGEEINIGTLTSRAEVPINDTSDFIRNTNMVIDYVEESKMAQDAIKKIKDAMEKVKDFFSFD